MKHLLTAILILLLTGCAAPLPEPEPEQPPAPEMALIVNDREVPLWNYRYWLSLACQQAEELYRQSGQEPDWTATGPDSLQEQVRSQAIADAALCAVVQQFSDTWNIVLTQEDQAHLQQLWQERVAAHGGEDAYLSSLADQGLTGEEARQLAEIGARYQKLQKAALDPSHPCAPSAETLSAFARDCGFVTFDQISVTGEDARHRIEVLFSSLNTASDPQAAFAALSQQGDNATGQRSYCREDPLLPADLDAALNSLQPGQHSGILKNEDGYTILLRLPPDLLALVPQWMDTMLLNASKDAEIELLPAFYAEKIPIRSVSAAEKSS